MRALTGRMNCATYWLWFSLCGAFVVALNIMGSKHGAPGEVILVFLCVPRLHDIGLSGWYVLIGFGIELAGLVIGLAFFPLDQAMDVIGLAVILIAVLMMWLGCVRGDPRPNKWGDPPGRGLNFRNTRSA
jgi:uncharacterized membrane protein YhaH (DUF805 family)